MIVVSGTRAEVVTSHIPCRHARHIPPSRASSPFPVVVTSNPCHTLGMSPCAQDMRRRRGDVWSQTTLDLHIPGRVLVQFDEVRFLRSVETSGRVRDASKVGKARRRPQPTTTSRRICIARPPPPSFTLPLPRDKRLTRSTDILSACCVLRGGGVCLLLAVFTSL